MPEIETQKNIIDFFGKVENEIAEPGSEIKAQEEYLEKLRQQCRKQLKAILLLNGVWKIII